MRFLGLQRMCPEAQKLGAGQRNLSWASLMILMPAMPA